MQSIGQDHNTGHRTYVAQLPPATRDWLQTKPFSAPPSYELARCMRSFAHIVESLDLSLGAHVLDVGCGPGWISEWLLRCGYQVTGVDISDDMIEIARERAGRIGAGQDRGPTTTAWEFTARPVQEIEWEDEFDAAILYDAMHHFDDERATLTAINRAVVPGGQIYIHEGVRPAPGSDAERELIEEMERYGTLEAPFDPEYLVEVVEQSGFTDVQRLVEVDELMPAGRPRIGALRVRRRLGEPDTNTLIGTKPVTVDAEDAFSATLELLDTRSAGNQLLVRIAATNTGRRRWKAGSSAVITPPDVTGDWVARRPLHGGAGNINVGLFADVDGERHFAERGALLKAVQPGERIEFAVAIDEGELPPGGKLGIDLVLEHVAWFADLGSTPLEVPVEYP